MCKYSSFLFEIAWLYCYVKHKKEGEGVASVYKSFFLCSTGENAVSDSKPAENKGNTKVLIFDYTCSVQMKINNFVALLRLRYFAQCCHWKGFLFFSSQTVKQCRHQDKRRFSKGECSYMLSSVIIACFVYIHVSLNLTLHVAISPISQKNVS